MWWRQHLDGNGSDEKEEPFFHFKHPFSLVLFDLMCYIFSPFVWIICHDVRARSFSLLVSLLGPQNVIAEIWLIIHSCKHFLGCAHANELICVSKCVLMNSHVCKHLCSEIVSQRDCSSSLISERHSRKGKKETFKIFQTTQQLYKISSLRYASLTASSL